MLPPLGRSHTIAYVLTTTALIVLTLVLVSRAAVDDHATIAQSSPLIQADLFWPAVLYQDLVHDGYSPRTFQFSAVTFWFPDVALFFAVRSVAAPPPQALLIWAALLYLLVVVGAMVFVGTFTVGRSRAYALTAVALIGATFLGCHACWAFRDAGIQDLMLPLYRPGTTFNVFLALALLVEVVRRRPERLAPWLPVCGLAVLTALAVLSDRLFVVWFVAPALAALGLFRALFGAAAESAFPLTWRRIAVAAAALAVGSMMGRLGIEHFPTDTVDPLSLFYKGLLWNGAWDRTGLLASDFWGEVVRRNPLAGSAAAAALAAGLFLAGSLRHRRKPTVDRALVFLSLLFLFSGAAAAAAFVLSHTSTENLGRMPWPTYSRYLLGPLGLALFGWAVLIGRVVDRASRHWLRGVVLAAPVLTLAAVAVELAFSIGRPVSDFSNIYPDFVADIDRVCRDRNLRRGLAVYDFAKTTTQMSQAGVCVEQIQPYKIAEPGFLAFPWLSNGAHFWRGPADDPENFRPQFVIVPQTDSHNPIHLQLAEVLDRFGEPAERVPIHRNLMVLVYNRPSDARFQNFAECDREVLNLRFRANRPHIIHYPGASFHYPRDDSRPRGFPDRTAEPGLTAPGLIACGPNLAPPVSGRYRATFRTSAETNDGGWLAVVIHYPDDGRQVTAATIEVPMGDRRETVVDFAVDRDMRKRAQIEFLTHYHGRGRLSLHGVDLEVLPPCGN